MVDANEKHEAPSNFSPEKDASQAVIAPSTILSTSIMNFEKTVVASGITDNMEEEKEEEEEEVEEEEEEEEEVEEEEEEEEEEEPEEGEEEKVNDGGRTMVAVNNEGLNIEEEHNKGKAIEEETNKENAVKEGAIKGEDEKKTEEPKNGKELGENLKKKGRRARKRNRKKDTQKEKVAQKVSGPVAMDGDKPESSSKKNASKRVESMGMVFMCSSKTKNDCFRYKILGLPASKKDQVAKIYKGMRLFLFDVDLRLMYGIFKAAGPGGYNIEPKAFKSGFPSQVRFTVLEDCLPLAEEKFKEAIKENYYTRNKFEGRLKAEQVKKLCKLFVVTGKDGPRPKTTVKSRRTEAVENHRIRADESRRSRADDAHTSRDRKKRKRRLREEERHPHSPSVREKRRYPDYERPPVLYEPEAPVPRYLPLPQPAVPSPVRSYGYERALEMHPYMGDRLPERRTYRVLDVEPRHHDEILIRDREREQDRDRDRDPYHIYTREAPSYRDTVYALPPEYHLVSRDYHPPAVQPAEYHLSGGSHIPSYRDVEVAPDYRSSAASLPDYRPHRTHYRY